jgi:hypothetical protein
LFRRQATKVCVVGQTDKLGDKALNAKLARERSQLRDRAFRGDASFRTGAIPCTVHAPAQRTVTDVGTVAVFVSISNCAICMAVIVLPARYPAAWRSMARIAFPY